MEPHAFMIDQFQLASIWLAAWFLALIVFRKLLLGLGKIPIIGAIASIPLLMVFLHSMLSLYGLMHVLGFSERITLITIGVIILVIIFMLAFWVALDNVRKGNVGL